MNQKLLDALERAGWTFAQTFAGALVATQATGLTGFDWKADVLAAAVAAGVSILKSLGINVSLLNLKGKQPQVPVSPNHPFVAETDSK